MSKTFSTDAVTINWFTEEVFVELEGATQEGLEAAAYVGEGAAKSGVLGADLVDTGFMLNTIYARGANSSSFSGGDYPEAQLESDLEAIIAAGAHYTIYQEVKHGFMYAGLQAAAAALGGEVAKAAKAKGF